MSWTDFTRRQYARGARRYASDLTDSEWGLISPWLPGAKRLGRPRSTDLREVVNALLYMATTGCQWRMLPKDFPPFTTVQSYFYEWRATGLWGRINHHLVMEARELEGREASPSAGVIDSQSVKTTESGGISGYDAGKKIKGRKRHIVVDTLGLMVGLVVHSADIQDRDGAPAVLKTILKRWPWLKHIFADGGYAGPKLKGALQKIAAFTLQIVKRTDKAKGFEVLPRRWVVERTFAWLGRCRRLAKDWEKSIASAQAWITIAHIRVLTRRLARYRYYRNLFESGSEMRVRRTAHAMGLRFRLHRKDLPGTPDLVLPSRRLAVFVHGCFWHRHEGCRLASVPKSNEETWTKKFERNVARDAKAISDLRTMGWRTATIWECETRKADVLAEVVAGRMADVDRCR